ncbi:hypothetical protein [Streptomyces sp. NPDC059564]|uniref:hypothetical protein n=1 Tax=Streptomyces sp. NPDC059564 TaxID=3346865 RepID=UPI0036C3F8C3
MEPGIEQAAVGGVSTGGRIERVVGLGHPGLLRARVRQAARAIGRALPEAIAPLRTEAGGGAEWPM